MVDSPVINLSFPVDPIGPTVLRVDVCKSPALIKLVGLWLFHYDDGAFIADSLDFFPRQWRALLPLAFVQHHAEGWNKNRDEVVRVFLHRTTNSVNRGNPVSRIREGKSVTQITALNALPLMMENSL